MTDQRDSRGIALACGDTVVYPMGMGSNGYHLVLAEVVEIHEDGYRVRVRRDFQSRYGAVKQPSFGLVHAERTMKVEIPDALV